MYKRYRRKRYSSFGIFELIVVLIGGFALLTSIYSSLMSSVQNLLFVLIGTAVFTIVIMTFVYLYLKKRGNEQLRALVIADVDKMTGVEFERYVGEIFKSQGYMVHFTATSGDYGIDIVAQKGPDKYGVQLKRYSGHVGRAGISDAVAGMRYYNCNKCMVVTTNYFTANAKHLAKSNETCRTRPKSDTE
jgi:restriction system protein